jgi:phosphoesterase RecJ-like protein
MLDSRFGGMAIQIKELVSIAQRMLVVSHVRPDGDAIGSLLGLGLSLRAFGKDVEMVLADGIPTSYRHLQGTDLVLRSPKTQPDLVWVVDSSDIQRTGTALANHPLPDINIDHHITNLNFARLNLVDPEAAATAQILADLLPYIGLPVTQPVAAALLTGIITDTIGFRTSNLTPEVLRTSASLMEKGAPLSDLYNRSLVQRSFEAARYWGAGLNRLQRAGNLVWTTLTLSDRKEVEYPGRDDADLINLLSSIENAHIAVIFVEQTKNRVKISWRSHFGFDVSKIALQFGGGGHPAASGAEVVGELEQVQKLVLETTHESLQIQSNEALSSITRHPEHSQG